MCVNPRDLCVTFISFVRSCGKKPENSILDFLPEEVVKNILDSMEYKQISKLRSVNRSLNYMCSKYLNQAFFKIKKDIENFIFESFDDLIVDGKYPEEIIKTVGLNNTYIDYSLYKPTINKILFANKILLILIILRDGIFRYMFYRNYKTADEHFVFFYGNCLDWAARKLNLAKQQSVTLKDTATLIPPPEVTQHLDRIIAFYKHKIRLSRTSTTDIETYIWSQKEIEKSYLDHVLTIVVEVEMLFFATHSFHSLPPKFRSGFHYSFDIRKGYLNRGDLFSRAIFCIDGECLDFYLGYMRGTETEFRVDLINWRHMSDGSGFCTCRNHLGRNMLLKPNYVFI